MLTRFAPAALLLLFAPAAHAQCGCAAGAIGSGFAAAAPGWVPLGGFAQPRPPELGGGTPYLPDPAALERLHLVIDWVGYLPVAGLRDSIATVQVAGTTQIFVQTKSGLLVALDAVTGAKQWAFRYQSNFVNLFPVGWNDDFVFAVNVSRLIAINRLTGAVAFDFELPGGATAGPAADAEQIYVVTSGNRLTAYRFPPALLLTAALRPAIDALGNPPASAAVAIADRYAGPEVGLQPAFVQERVPPRVGGDFGLSPNQLTPSITALTTVTPPYTITNRGLFATPSLGVLPTTQTPYTLRPDYLRFNQQTPSLSVLPSVARLSEMATFAPTGPRPVAIWSVLTTNRILGNPILTDRDAGADTIREPKLQRVWVASPDRGIQAFDRHNGRSVIDDALQGAPAAPLAGPVAVTPDRVLAFGALLDGNVVAVDLLRGGDAGIKIDWRTPVGGLLNHKPVATRQSLYAHGNQAGVARLDINTGDLVWKTADSADRYLAANDEFVYVRDLGGDLLVYDRKAVPPSRRVEPLARLPLLGYRVPVTNDVTDRILLASETGLLVALRDANPKYAIPVRLVPAVPKVAAKKNELPPVPKAK